LKSRPNDKQSANRMLQLAAQKQDIQHQMKNNPDWVLKQKNNIKKKRIAAVAHPPAIVEKKTEIIHIPTPKKHVFRKPVLANPSNVRFDADFEMGKKDAFFLARTVSPWIEVARSPSYANG